MKLSNYLTRSSLINDFKFLTVIATISVCVGFLLNQIRDRPLALLYQSKIERLNNAVKRVNSARADGSEIADGKVRYISLDEFLTLSTSGGRLILDARPEMFYRLGHVPKAIALPRDEFEMYYEKHRSLLGSDKEKLLLVYCQGGTCEDSNLLAYALRRLGFSNIAIFSGGWEEWQRNRLPEETL